MTLDGRLEIDVAADAVTFAFTVTNTGDDPVEVTFPSGKRADAVVYPADSIDGTDAADDADVVDPAAADTDAVWRWSDGQMFTMAVETATLDPGEQFTVEMTWSDPPSGEYAVDVSLDAMDASLAVRESVTVP